MDCPVTTLPEEWCSHCTGAELPDGWEDDIFGEVDPEQEEELGVHEEPDPFDDWFDSTHNKDNG